MVIFAVSLKLQNIQNIPARSTYCRLMNDVYGSTFHGFESYVITVESIGTEIACSRGNFDRLVIEFFVQHFLFRFRSSLRIAFVSFYILGYIYDVFILSFITSFTCFTLYKIVYRYLYNTEHIEKCIQANFSTRKKSILFIKKNLILNINERRSLYSVKADVGV